MYKGMDPSDSTRWKERSRADHMAAPSTKRQQLKDIHDFKSFLEGEMSTTPAQDSSKSRRMRTELKQLLAKREALRQSITAEEDSVIASGKHPSDWHGAVKPDPAQSEDVIDRLTRREDSKATFHTWIAGQEARVATKGRTQDLSEGKEAMSSPAAGGGKNADLVKDAEAEQGQRKDSQDNIERRAAYKVSRWMGGGYIPVYDLAQG